jgi:hypothetical protein
MFACERAVALKPEEWNFQDSRGVARAMTGNITGAIEDFQTFIEGTENHERKSRRQRWVDELRAGENPFTDTEVKRLLNE